MILRLFVMFLLGLGTWLLVLLRGLALEKRRLWSLSGLIFVDECVGIGTGVFLARWGTWTDMLAVAAGGAIAAWVVLRINRSGTGNGSR
ncbi:MAG: hypothetical protein ABFE01_16770 [Phycisphaerales bacterium]